MLRRIKGEKIKQARGERSLQTVADASGGRFSDVSLLSWEREDYRPKEDKLPILLKALGCSYEDISEEVDLSVGV